MKVEKLLKRLKIEFIKVNLIQSSLDSILFFLISNLTLFLFSVQVTRSFENYVILGGLTVFFFLGDLFYRIRTYHLEIYEEKNPELREVLRTARDNLDKSNTVSQALFDELIKRARSITSESIIPSQKIIQKIVLIGFLCFLTVGSGLINFQILDTDSNIVPELGLDSENDSRVNTTSNNSDILNGSDVMGEPEDIDVKSRDLNFDIRGTGESETSDYSFESSSDGLAFESLDNQNEENMKLTKEYSLAIRNFE